jgi:HK97 gp10 family phage protein
VSYTFTLDSTELRRHLDQMPIALARGAARDSLQAAADVVAAGAEENAPRRSGALAEDIVTKVHVSGDLRGSYAIVGPGYDRTTIPIRKRGAHAGEADSTASPGVYGKFVESGHAPPGLAAETRRARRSGKEIEYGGRETPPHPWFRPAWEATKDQAFDALARTLAAEQIGIARQLNGK